MPKIICRHNMKYFSTPCPSDLMALVTTRVTVAMAGCIYTSVCVLLPIYTPASCKSAKVSGEGSCERALSRVSNSPSTCSVREGERERGRGREREREREGGGEREEQREGMMERGSERDGGRGERWERGREG